MFLKIFLLGIAKVGKSSLLSRFCSGRSFDAGYHESVGPDFNGTKVLLQNGLEAVLQIWDLPGNPTHLNRLNPPKQTYYAETHVCVLVCDMCSKESFLALERLREDFLNACAATKDSVAFVLLINKAEPTHAKKQQVFASDVLTWCAKHNIRHFYETSALTDTNILIALVNITQLASEMDAIRRGIKIQMDREEMLRREAEERALAEAEKKAAEDAEAARLQAEQDALENARKLQEEKEEAERKRALDFEERWSAQKQEQEALKAAALAEKQRLVQKRREEAERRKKEVASSAYGAFKQRPHRLSAALIQQHAQASGVTDPSILSPLTLNTMTSPHHGAGAGGGAGGLISPSAAGAGATGSFSISEDGSQGVPPLHKPGSLPPSLHHQPKTQKRHSVLGMGTGALLKQVSQSLDTPPGSSGKIDERPDSRSTAASTPDISAVASGNVPTPPAGGRARKGSFIRPSSRSSAAASAKSTALFVQPDAAATSTGESPVPSPSGSGSLSLTPRKTPSKSPMGKSGRHSSTERRTAALKAVVVEHPPLDSLSESLMEYICGYVGFSRNDCLDFYALFNYMPAGLPYAYWRSRVWRKFVHLNPLYAAQGFAERVFAACDRKHQGLVEYEDFIVVMNSITNGNTAQKADVVFDMLDFFASPFVLPSPETMKTAQQPVLLPPPSNAPSLSKTNSKDASSGDASATNGTEEKSSSELSPRISPKAISPPVVVDPEEAKQPVLHKNSFLQYHRTALHGEQSFAFLMYNDESEEVNSTGAAGTRKGEQCFITRACVKKIFGYMLEATPGFESALAACNSKPTTDDDGSSPTTSSSAPPMTKAALVASMEGVVERKVDEWWVEFGFERAECLTRKQWRDAVRRKPHLMQSFLPHKAEVPAVIATTAASIEQTSS